MKSKPTSDSDSELNNPLVGSDETVDYPARESSSVPAQEAGQAKAAGDGQDRTKITDNTSPQQSRLAPLPIGTEIANRYQIIAELGSGGFGIVYRALDKQLGRDVAIKTTTGLRSFVAGRVRDEAKTVASLNHPRIVAIHDLVELRADELLIVMECLEGQSLDTYLGGHRLSAREAVTIGAQILDALQHAHAKKIVHSDLKPGNLFVLQDRSIKLLDFGLAVAYFPEDRAHRAHRGTPGYMSPEQIRGESHRIDGRVDIWAFGVVMYEMLTGSRPFAGATTEIVFEATLNNDVPPLRQLNPSIDEELQRIVLRCLQKRMSDRYDSVAAVHQDLRLWLGKAGQEPQHSVSHITETADVPVSTRPNTSVRIRTRGLQPFGAEDADVYVSLIPGPRDRSGTPDSILFWKRWIESDDADSDYPVGVLYGPSGSGKTSYIQAGLLPRISGDVCPVYVECHGGNLAARLARIIHAKLHDDSQDSSLRDFLNRLRSGNSSNDRYRKLLIVLDQFEAWAHQASLEERREFAESLRQCDGQRIRALVVTRDDYWMGVTELLRWLELPLQEGRNIASVDLLDPAYAKQFLEAAGRDLGTLPDAPTALSATEQQFIDQAVGELTNGGTVICVHLVMFAQMVRLQQWTPRALRAAGGVSGACSLFLQEMFQPTGTGQHSPEYRRIAPAALTVLSVLLPDSGDSVAAVCIGKAELHQRCQQAGCAALLDDCLRILVEDLCIVTIVSTDADEPTSGDAQYRLAHDFLVCPVSDWINRVQKRTARGRASARLSEMSEAWSLRQNKTQLPRFGEYLYLQGMSPLIRPSDRQRKYLRAAARHHAGRISVAALAMLAFCGMTFVAIEQRRQRNAAQQQAEVAKQKSLVTQIDLLFHGPATEITRQIKELAAFGDDAVEQVQRWADSQNPDLQLRAAMFLQSQRPETFEGLASRLETAPDEYFAPLLATARQIPDAIPSLQSLITPTASLQAQSRAAILLAYLGNTTALQKFLTGTNDADIDTNFLSEAAVWRGSPAVWLEMLNTHADPQVRYHAGVVIGSYPRARIEEAASAGTSFDFATLINSKEVVLHSLGLFLGHHLGVDVAGTPVQPPADANWKLGPDSIPMVRLPAGTYEFYPVPKLDNDPDQYEIENDFWFATIPISRSLYQEFLDDPAPLDHPTATKQTEIFFSDREPPALRADDAQPIQGIDYTHAICFCNWLSRRDGLEACYEYQPNASAVTKIGDFQMNKLRWKTMDAAAGYRLPTFAQFSVAVRADYNTGTPWSHVLPIGISGGDYEQESGGDYCRQLYSLIPNRRGVFANQGYCGSWASGNDFRSALSFGNDVIFTGTAAGQSIYLVQPIDETP
jgi:serine/threonine protein kinase